MGFLPLIGPLLNVLLGSLAPVGKHLLYPLTVRSKMQKLESAIERLKAQKMDVNTTIMTAEHQNRMATEEIKVWQANVQAIEEKTEEITNTYTSQCQCILNICPNLCSNYKISKNAVKTCAEVEKLREEIKTIQVSTDKPPVLGKVIPVSSSKSPNLQLALDSIKKHSVIGIWGIGGMGKTHLLKQVNNDLVKNGGFNAVVFVTCSQGCSQKKVQDAIIKELCLNESGSTVEERGSTILSFLQEKSFVLLLDDMWDRVDLESIGIPAKTSAEDTTERKIVLTTRSRAVCGAMGAIENIHIDRLKWDQSWSLFTKNVTEGTVRSHPIIQQYAKDMVKELAGLPLALITIGKTMSNKIDPRQWELAVKRLQEGRPPDVTLSSTDESIYRTLMLSYDDLPAILQQCFLHCSLWPEGSNILKHELIELWMGLGLINEPDDIHTAYNAGYSYVSSLQDVGLLETIDILQFPVDDFYVKMHDVIRDMALWIARNHGAQMDKWIVPHETHTFEEIQISPHTKKLSLKDNYTEIRKVSLYPTVSSPELSLLICRKLLFDSNALPLVLFSKLTVLDLSHCYLEAFPAEICHQLVHLQYLDLSWNYGLISLPQEMDALTNLKYLLLRGSWRCTIPTNVLCKLSALRLVDLTCSSRSEPEHSSRTFTFLEKELKCLSHFKALGITIFDMDDFQKLSTSTVPIRWLRINNLLVQEGCLSISSNFLGNTQLVNNLITLEFRHISAEYIKFERSNNQGIYVKFQNICHLGKLDELKFSFMANTKQIVWMNLDPTDVFLKLQVLTFWVCTSLTSISWIACLPCIRELEVQGCSSIKQLVRIDELNKNGLVACQPFFSCLKRMNLSFNDLLELISDPLVTFPALEIMSVCQCNRLRKLPFKSDNCPRVLRLEGFEDWWNNIEMDDISHRSLLQPFFRYKKREHRHYIKWTIRDNNCYRPEV